MKDELTRQLTRMLRWQDRGMTALGALLLLGCADLAAALCDLADTPVAMLLRFGVAIAWLATVALWLVVVGFVFRTGQVAFGTGPGLGYLLLGLLLWPWPGLYVVPHMVRLDVQRLRGVGTSTDGDPSGPRT
jgi:hypothetical protein